MWNRAHKRGALFKRPSWTNVKILFLAFLGSIKRSIYKNLLMFVSIPGAFQVKTTSISLTISIYTKVHNLVNACTPCTSAWRLEMVGQMAKELTKSKHHRRELTWLPPFNEAFICLQRLLKPRVISCCHADAVWVCDCLLAFLHLATAKKYHVALTKYGIAGPKERKKRSLEVTHLGI